MIKTILNSKGYKIKFVHLENCYADYDEDTKTIRIDLHNNVPPGRKFLHEILHKCFPDMSEAEASKKESKIWKKLTQKQKVLLYRKLFQC